MNFLVKFSDQVPKNVENGSPINELPTGEDQSSQVKTKVSTVSRVSILSRLKKLLKSLSTSF